MADQQSGELEGRLKSILQLCVELLKPRLKTKTQIAELQDLLVDYQNNEELAEIIENVLKMTQKYGKVTAGDQSKSMVEEEQYNKLEQCVQALQARQRVYIKNENQLKLYCEELQAKVKELEESKNELVVSTKKVILDLKRDNQNLVEKLRATTQRDQLTQKPHQPGKSNRKQSIDGHEKLPRQLKANDRAESSLRSKLEQYQQVIDSIEASRGRKGSFSDKEKPRHQIK